MSLKVKTTAEVNLADVINGIVEKEHTNVLGEIFQSIKKRFSIDLKLIRNIHGDALSSSSEEGNSYDYFIFELDGNFYKGCCSGTSYGGFDYVYDIYEVTPKEITVTIWERV